MKNVLISGGYGFIASNLIHYILDDIIFEGKIINVDKLTYAAEPKNLKGISTNRCIFERGDICNYDFIYAILKQYDIGAVIHLAANSHVDNSILNPQAFLQDNTVGTFTLLEAVRKYNKDIRFHLVSSDEIFGELDFNKDYFYETTPYKPNNIYSASKASGDLFAHAYYHTFGLNITISHCSNNYGPYQHVEKLIPKVITNILNEKPIPVYGEGKNVRDWLFVKDHCSAIWAILDKGKIGEEYNIGGENEWENIRLVKTICKKIANKFDKEDDYYYKLIKFVEDRLGHDKRYAINCDKLKNELGWKQSVDFDKGLDMTIEWYINSSTGIFVVEKPIRILAIAEGPIPSVHLGIVYPFDKLKEEGIVTYDLKFIREIIKAPVFNMDEYDVIFLLRICSSESLEKILFPAIKAGKKVIYMLDDDFPSLNPETEVGKFYHKMNASVNIVTFLAKADCAMLCSVGLYEKYKHYNKNTIRYKGPSNIEIIETFTSRYQQKISNVVTIGYAAGVHHTKTFDVVSTPIYRILQEYGDRVTFECFFNTKPEVIKKFKNVVALYTEPNINKYYETLASRYWDIGIAPIPITEFHASKSNNKYREYAAFGIAGVYTDVLTYYGSVKHEYNGMLSKNTNNDWYLNIKKLIENKQLRNTIVKNAKEDIRKNYTMENVVKDYKTALKLALGR